jgi:hypothetical protein
MQGALTRNGPSRPVIRPELGPFGPYDRAVQLRRGLLAFAIVLAAVSFGAALSAPDDEGEPATTTPQTARSASPQAVTTTLAQPVRGAPPVRRVRTGAHVILRVSAAAPGNVEIPSLGLLEPVAPRAPAVFDLLASRAGRFTVQHVSLTGEATRLGVLAVGG